MFHSTPLPLGRTQRQVLAVAIRRLAARPQRLITSDHLALRVAAPAALFGGVAVLVWWALAMVATL